MGKEQLGATRGIPVCRRKNPRIPTPSSSYAEVWGENEAQPSVNDVSEHGSVLVIVKEGSKETVLLCNGMANEGNTYHSLVVVLTRKGYVPYLFRCFQCFHCVDFLWVPVDANRDVYNSGESVLLLIEPLPPSETEAVTKKPVLKRKTIRKA